MNRLQKSFTLAEVFNAAGRSRKIAFTLAEVLITLGIIGVVAAMTMPTLIENHQKSVTVNSLKKFYSTMAQAKVASEQVNGEMEYWDFSENTTRDDRAKIFDKYFRPFLNVVGECERGVGCMNVNHSNNIHPHYILNDGTIFQFSPGVSTINGNWAYVLFDINGNKGPNKIGRDVFALNIYVKGPIMLGAISEEVDEDNNVIKYKLSTRDELINGIILNDGENTACCTKDTSCGDTYYRNINCGALIQMDGWQISKDYPW